MSSNQQVCAQPAYVLHSRPYKETSSLVDYLTPDYGRIRLVAKGVRRPKSNLRAALQPFVPLQISWQGRGELKNLVDADILAVAPFRQGRTLWCGLYLNELMTRMLPFGDAMPRLFAYYRLALEGLDDDESQQPLLRIFERSLLAELGFAVSFEQTLAAHSGAEQTVAADKHYLFDSHQGFTEADPETINEPCYPGSALLAIARDDYRQPETARVSKAIMRRALAPHLGNQPLMSRQLFQQRASQPIAGNPARNPGSGGPAIYQRADVKKR